MSLMNHVDILYNIACKVELQLFNRSYSQLTFSNYLSKLLVVLANATAAVLNKSSLVLTPLLVSLHVGPAQLLYIASEIALARLSHPVADADLHDGFSDRQNCTARMRKACRDQQERGVT